MIRSVLRFLLTASLFAPALSCWADDWYRWRGPDLSGVSAENDWDHDRIVETGSKIWRCNVGTGFASLVTKGDYVYTTGNQDESDTVYCLGTATGNVIWKHSYPSPLDPREFEGGPTSTPTIDNDRLYAISREGDLFCFAAKSGEVIWQQQIVDLAGVRVPGWGFAASPLIVDNVLLINAGDAGVALNKMTGNLIWKSADKDCGYGTPTLMKTSHQTLAILPSGRSYVAVDVQTGKERWRQRWLTSFGCNAADPIIDANRVFLSSGYNRGAALLDVSTDQPEVLWKNKAMQNQVSASILIDGFLYGVDGDVDTEPRLTCLSLESGDVQWSDAEIMPGAITATADRLIIITKTGELVIAGVDPEKLDVLARTKVLDGRCLTSPVLSNQKIFCRDASGEIVCLDVSPLQQ